MPVDLPVARPVRESLSGPEAMMRARTWAALAGMVAAAAIAAGVVVIFSRSASPSPGTGGHVVKAAERGSGRSASMVITDPYAAGSKLRRVEYPSA